jgi:exopolysaccharide biosynthesis polyprenyl glycosylphosphotransferase
VSHIKTRSFHTKGSRPYAVTVPALGRNRSFAEIVSTGSRNTIVSVSIDIVSASASVAVGVWWSSTTKVVVSPWSAFLFVPIVVILLGLQAFYRPRLDRRFIDEIGPAETTIALGALLLLSVATLSELPGPSGRTLSRVWICAALLMPLARLIHATVRHGRRRHRRFRKPTLIVGNGTVAARVVQRLKDSPEYGLEPIGIIDLESPNPRRSMDPAPDPDIPILTSPDSIEDVIRRTGAEAILITFSPAGDELLTRIVQIGFRHRLRIWVVPRMFDVVGERSFVEHIGGLPLLALSQTDPLSWHFTVKHVLDRVGAALGLLLISPVFLVLVLLVRLSSPGAAFFRQARIGRDGKIFDCLKFRTMRVSTCSDAEFPLVSSSAPGGVEGEDRRTTIGKIMRSASLDELPQLVNVLRGEMSLVGPRPERPQFVEYFEMQISRYGERHRVKAGMTGWAQVHGLRGQTSIADRVEWDNYYIQNWSLALDMKILLLTVPAVMRGAD